MASILPTLKFIAAHPVSSKRPVSAYWRYVRWQIESRLRDEVVFNWIEGSKLVARNGMAGATGNIYCGLHEFEDMAFVLHLMRPEDTIVDVGANIGSYTILASKVCGAKSIAVEPDPSALRALKRNLRANGVEDRVELIQAALGAESGIIEFTIGKDTTNRIATSKDVETQKVPLRTLDEVLAGSNPLIIKMDVEGYEGRVISASLRALQNPSLKAVLIETVDSEVRAILEASGFQKRWYDPFERQLLENHSNGKQESRNSLYIRDEPESQRRLQTMVKRSVFGLQL